MTEGVDYMWKNIWRDNFPFLLCSVSLVLPVLKIAGSCQGGRQDMSRGRMADGERAVTNSRADHVIMPPTWKR